MKIKRLHIQNFRSIIDLDIPLDDTTVFIGVNNAGKSAILEALRIALSRRWGQRGTGFTENDIHLPSPEADPRECPSPKIKITFEESIEDEWPEDMVSDLDDVVTITEQGLSRITLAVTYSWNTVDEVFEPAWEFYDSAGNPLPSRRRSINLSGFYNYVLFYWLGALRDAGDEFTSRSSHWGGLLKSMKIPVALEKEIIDTLDELDSKILNADKRFAKISETIGKSTEVAAGETAGAAKLRMLPINLWDLLSRAGIVIKNESTLPWLPLNYHGQGLQSLAVIFLLQAVIENTLEEDVTEGAEPIFAIEEPEVHLHPQAARTLWGRISNLSGQKLVSTHSPYFIQHVPFKNIRYVRSVENSTTVSLLKSRIISNLPWTKEVENLVTGKKITELSKNAATNTIMALNNFDTAIEKDLIKCWKSDSDLGVKTKEIQDFRHECRTLISQTDEKDLVILGRRIRGEIFFAKKWILVEGQTEYLLLHALGASLDYDLDQHGIAVIDFQNNGNPSIYAALAEAFEIPWVMVTDGDAEGQKFQDQLIKRGFNTDDLTTHVKTHTKPNDLEDQLLDDGHEALLREILLKLSITDTKTCSKADFVKSLKKRKTAYMSELAPMVSANTSLANKMPKEMVGIITDLKTGKL